jgi:hypothetical protein
MENILENGTDWNLYENLRCFKIGEQNEYKTASNIRKLFIHVEESKRKSLELNYEAEIERQNIKLNHNE